MKSVNKHKDKMTIVTISRKTKIIVKKVKKYRGATLPKDQLATLNLNSKLNVPKLQFK